MGGGGIGGGGVGGKGGGGVGGGMEGGNGGDGDGPLNQLTIQETAAMARIARRMTRNQGIGEAEGGGGPGGGGEGGGGEGGADASTARCVVSSVLGARPAAERALRAAQLLRVSLALQPSSSAAALLGVAVAWSVPRPCGALDTYIHTYIHARIRTYVHTYIHACIHTYLHTYIHTRIRTYIHACIPPYIHGYLHTVLPRPSIRNVAIPS